MATISDLKSAPRNLPVPTGFLPEGVEESLFDANTLYLIKNALPELYYRIFLHLLYYATVDARTAMQPSLFEKTGEGQNEAIILYRSVAELAKSPHSPAASESYHKAILILEALHVLRRIFHRGFTEVRLPLGKREILIPALLLSLRELHGDEKRKGYRNVKVKQLARKVALRLQSGEFLAGIPRPPKAQDTVELKDMLIRLLLEHGITEAQIQQSRLGETCTAISQAMFAAKNGRVLGETGESVREGVRKAWGRKGDSFEKLEDSSILRDTTVQTEAPTSQEQTGEFLKKESPNNACPARTLRRRSPKKGDLDAIFGKESPESNRNLLFSAKTGDSLPGVSIIGSSSLVITHKGEKTLNDTALETPAYHDLRPHREIQEDVLWYQNRFDKGRGRRFPGSLYNVVKCTSPEIRHVAAIATHYYMVFRLPNGQTVKKPGAIFTKTCEMYRQPGAEIPNDIRAWAETGLSLDEIEVRLKQGIRHPGQLQLPLRGDDVALPGETVPGQEERDFAEPERYDLPVTPCPGAYDWMDEDEAKDLAARIEREKGHYCIQAEVFPGEEDGVFVVMTTWDGVEVVHQCPEEWITYFTGMKDYLEM